MSDTYDIEGISCEACIITIRGVVEQLPDVKLVQDPSNPLSAKVKLNDDAQTEVLRNALKRKGYRLQPSEAGTTSELSDKTTYWPLILIVAFLLLAVGLAQWRMPEANLITAMRQFMGGFFIIFSFFKLLDLNGFARSYRQYDLLAAKWPLYGFIYPFLELVLGIYYLSPLDQPLMVWLTVILMTFSSLGVAKSLLDKRKIKCACLGTVFNLPMSSVTLIEDLVMVIMAAYMLVI